MQPPPVASYDNGLQRSTDLGGSWTTISKSFKSNQVWRVAAIDRSCRVIIIIISG